MSGAIEAFISASQHFARTSAGSVSVQSWVGGSAKFFLDVAVSVAWCHVARKIMATAGPFCRWSSRPALESNQGMTGAPGSANFGQISLKVGHSGQQNQRCIFVTSF